eukprot:SAG22_NODE_4069_length_1397_cov_6.004622_2_plen_49_part_01
MNLLRNAKTADELARVDRYIKAHCPVTHGFKIGGACAPRCAGSRHRRRS